MEETKSNYLLSYDFRIFYTPGSLFTGVYKELNKETLKFELYDDNTDFIEYSYPIEVSEINSIVKSILMGNISYLLSDENITWIREFEEAYSKNPELLQNDKYVFNYLTLKIMLMGFSESKALDITKSYFKYKMEGKSVISIKKMIKAINENISKKEFWITNKMDLYEDLEISFLMKILNHKTIMGFEFDYRNFEKEYSSICNKSFSKENYLINSNKNYPVKKIKKLQEQTPYILQSYESIIATLINSLTLYNFPKLQKESQFLTNLLSDMKNTLSLTMLTWEKKCK